MSNNDKEMVRDHNVQATCAMLWQILRAAQTGGLSPKLSGKIERVLGRRLGKASDESLLRVVEGIQWVLAWGSRPVVWNR
jgi:hypothetical protein